MSIVELMQKAKISASKRTKVQRKQLLVDAKILTTQGSYYVNYFSQETVDKSKHVARTA